MILKRETNIQTIHPFTVIYIYIYPNQIHHQNCQTPSPTPTSRKPIPGWGGGVGGGGGGCPYEKLRKEPNITIPKHVTRQKMPKGASTINFLHLTASDTP